MLFLPLLRSMSRWERIALAVFAVFFLTSFGVLLRQFYVANTMLVPSTGGTYIEGSVGDLQQLNPWFAVTNDVNHDVISLVFAGLLKYNPETEKIEEDLATLNVSTDGLIYTLKLKENLFWHDSTKDAPHPVTADDVVYTFGVTQDQTFPNILLQQNFRGVVIEKIDGRTVRFKLEEPYSFFTSNLTLGLLPKRAFDGVPIGRLHETLDFSLKPIGAGPYKLRSIVQTELSTEVTLERFERTIKPEYRLDRVVLRIFPDYQTLLSDLRNLDGVRLVPRNTDGEPLVPRRYQAITYTLPQYVALFFNLNKDALKDQNLRLGLQLGTNKQEISDGIHEPKIVDTPLLEIDDEDWRYQFDAEAAQGAFFASNWNLPEKIRLQHLLEQREANDVGILKIEPTILLDTGAVLTLTGGLARVGTGGAVNGLAIKTHPTSSGSWIVRLPTQGTGAVKLGENLIRLTKKNGNIVDSFYLWRTTNIDEYKRAREEQRLVSLFIDSRAGKVAVEKRIAVANLTLEKNMLRLRLSTDPVSVRRNEQGDLLTLRLLTSPSPEKYRLVAERIQKQWAALGVQVTLDIPKTESDFEQKLIRRDYDILLFGQSLLDNLDSYPYWHSSAVQKITGKREDLRRDAYNLSNYSSYKADTLLEQIRKTGSEKERQKKLEELRDVLKNDVPAVFLYSPLYTYAHRDNILGIDTGAMSLHSDRFLTLHKWYVKEDRVFMAGKGWGSFFGWLLGIL